MISIIIPYHNERENVPILFDKLVEELKQSGEYELIFVDDGSTDGSSDGIKSQIDNIHYHLIRHGKRLGKGKALTSGIKKAQGDSIMFMDADLQDDPEDIPAFIAKLNEGYDFVNGVRQKRKDNSIIKLYSNLANIFLKKFLYSPFTDINCGFKAFKKIILDDIALYANNFRFLPLAAYYRGYRVAEIPVHNKPRIHGKSKYGIGKVFIGMMDTLTAFFLYQFAEKPLHFFGTIGSIFFVTGFVMAFILSFERLFMNVLLYRRPSLLFAVLLIIVGIQIIMTGIIGELVVYLNKKKGA
jgi:glycosyltransferase involved in cell wall biosynthesis